jgi:hypothetical protein
MTTSYQDLIKKAYHAFNERNIDKALSTMQPDVRWSNGWEGGFVSGYDEIREYWTRQWKTINSHVDPIGFTERPNGSVAIEVHQHAKDLNGTLLFDGTVKHIFTFKDGLIQTMDIEK